MAPSAIVVGAGIFGLSIAGSLAADGWRVTLVERDRPGHPRQASAGTTRFIRCAHGADRWYAALARQARERWLALQEELGEELLVEMGVVWLARRWDGWEARSADVLAELGIPHERLSAAEVGRRFPSFAGEDLEWALLEPEAGVLRARRAVELLGEHVRRCGVTLRTGWAAPEGDAVRVGEERLRADRVVWACGAWLPRLFPSLVDCRVTRQVICYFAAPPGWDAGRVPGWIDFEGAAYGHGDLDGAGLKVSSDADGPLFDAERGSRAVDAESVAAAGASLMRRFPALAEAPFAHGEVCQYTTTADGHWVLAPHPEHPDVWLAGGDSGHGFKHGPALGDHVRDLVSGRTPPEARFGLGRRSGFAALRTGGQRHDA